MSSGELLTLKDRIGSIKNTEKTTKAMSMISSAKMKKSKVKLDKNNIYLKNLEDIGSSIFKYYKISQSQKYFKENSSKRKLILLLGSDNGLCGGFNNNVASYLRKEHKEKELELVIIGKKCKYYAEKFGYKIVNQYEDFKEIMTIKEARIIGNYLLDLFSDKQYGYISIVYTAYESATKQRAKEDIVLPFPKLTLEEEKIDYEIEPSLEEVLLKYIVMYIEEKLINAVHHSKTSEHSARMIAMDNSTKNAKEMSENLGLKYNQLRQSAITQEIAEIVGGAAALRKKRRN